MSHFEAELARQQEEEERRREEELEREAIMGMIEGEMFAEFGSSWVAGGGSASDVNAAWRQHRRAYRAGEIG